MNRRHRVSPTQSEPIDCFPSNCIKSKCKTCTFSSSILVLLILLGICTSEVGSVTLRPAWQWKDPFVAGITWPPLKSQGEVKACTCAFVDQQGYCIDSDAHGLKASFPCGILNVRNRAGSDETQFGMRPERPCYCSFNQGHRLA